MTDRPAPDRAAPDRADRPSTEQVERTRPPLVLWGFGPLVVALLLAAAVVLLVPSVAPERVVIQPGAPVPADAVPADDQPEGQEPTP